MAGSASGAWRGRAPSYLAHVEDDGTIVLRPAVVVTELEARLLTDPLLVARIAEGLADVESVEVDRDKL